MKNKRKTKQALSLTLSTPLKFAVVLIKTCTRQRKTDEANWMDGELVLRTCLLYLLQAGISVFMYNTKPLRFCVSIFQLNTMLSREYCEILDMTVKLKVGDNLSKYDTNRKTSNENLL